MGRKLIKVSDNTAIVIEPFKNAYGDYIGIREFYKPKSDLEGEWRPTSKGLSIPLDEETLKKVRKHLKWAEENFEEEHKVLESTKGSKGKKKDEDEKPSKKSKKDKKKSKKRDEDEGDDE